MKRLVLLVTMSFVSAEATATNPSISSCLDLDQKQSSENGGAELFGTGAAYQNVYDIIIHYPQYRAATAFHMAAVKNAPRPREAWLSKLVAAQAT